LFWVLNDRYEAFKFVWVEVTSTKIMVKTTLKDIKRDSPFIEINISLLANNV